MADGSRENTVDQYGRQSSLAPRFFSVHFSFEEKWTSERKESETKGQKILDPNWTQHF